MIFEPFIFIHFYTVPSYAHTLPEQEQDIIELQQFSIILTIILT